MNDQPKPATGEDMDIRYTETPYPATGEWTVETVAWFMQEYPDAWQHKLADAINAALAAERENAKQDGWYEGRDHERKLINEELAAERQNTRLANQRANSWKECSFEHSVATIQQLRKQLEEDKSVLKPLVDELTRMSFSYLATADELRQMARDALAKVEEGK